MDMLKVLTRSILGSLAAAALVACAAQSGGDKEVGEAPAVTTSASLIEEAQGSARVIEQVSSLAQAGWTVAPWSEARIETAQSPELPAPTSFVVLGASSKGAQVDIVYIPGVPADESMVLRPHDKVSGDTLQHTMAGSAESDLQQASASPVQIRETSLTGACTRSTWGCQYVLRAGFSIACVSPPPWGDNPLGRIKFMEYRNGCTWGQAWYGDYKGNAIICPYPNTGVMIPICGM